MCSFVGGFSVSGHCVVLAVCYPPTRLHGVVSQKAVICIFSSYKCKCLFMFLFVYADSVWPVLAVARGVL